MFFVNACFVVKASNKPIVTCFGLQLNPKKIVTKAKTLWTPLNIQRSKLIMIKWHFSRRSKTYVYLIFSTRTCIMWKKNSWKEIALWEKGRCNLQLTFVMDFSIATIICNSMYFYTLRGDTLGCFIYSSEALLSKSIL
jgi:hypothetical protein